MKIFLNRFVLAAGGDQSPENLRVNGKQSVQTANLLRADDAGVFPRGGRVNTITFATTREHASCGAAEAFLFTHAATLPSGGLLTAVCEDADGAQVRFQAQAAAVSADEGLQRGITTTHTYTLVCGAIGGGELPS